MNSTSRLVSASLLVVSMGAIVLAQKPALNLKMGLWELSSTGQVGGLPAIDTSKMTPEQKAAFNAVMSAVAGPTVVKSCFNEEKFDKANFMLNERDTETCKQTVLTNTPTTLEADITCTGDHPGTRQVHVEALSSTTFQGEMKFTSTENGRAITVDGTMTGKWLAADCGTVK